MAEDLQPIDLRHLEIQQHERRLAPWASEERAPVVQVVEGLRPIPDHDDLVGEVMLAQSRQRELDVVGVVFGQQNPLEFSHMCTWERGRRRGDRVTPPDMDVGAWRRPRYPLQPVTCRKPADL